MKTNTSKGFSLLELLITIAIFSMIAVMIVGAFSSIMRGRGSVEARSIVNSELRFAFQRIEQDVRNASSVTTPASIGVSSATLVLVVDSQTITYDVSGGQVRRQVGVSTAENITSSSTVTFAAPMFYRSENTNTVLSKTTVSITATLSASYNGANPERQYSESKRATMSLR